MNPLISLLIAVLVVALVLLLINRFVPMPAPARVILNAIVVLLVCCWLLSFAGLGAYNGMLVTFVVVCLILYLLNTLIKWEPYPHYQTWLNVVVAIVLCLVLLYMAGFLGSGSLQLTPSRPPVR